MGKGNGLDDDDTFKNAPYRINGSFNYFAAPSLPDPPIPTRFDGFQSPISLQSQFRQSADSTVSYSPIEPPAPVDANGPNSLKKKFKRITPSTPAKKKKKKRPSPIAWRPPKKLRAEFLRRVEASGLTIGGYLTQTVLNTTPPRRSRRPTATHQELAQIIGQLGRVGNNLNQLAKAANIGKDIENQIGAALDDLAEIRTVCIKAMGMKP